VKTRDGRRKMSAKWLGKLHDEYPHLAAQAIALNTRDNFIMHGQKENAEEKEKEKEEGKVGKKKSSDDSDVSKIKKKKEKHVLENSTCVQTNNMQHTDRGRTTQLMIGDMGEMAGRKDNEEDERKSMNKSKSKSKKRKDDDGY
jgi:hypothetical protein